MEDNQQKDSCSVCRVESSASSEDSALSPDKVGIAVTASPRGGNY